MATRAVATVVTYRAWDTSANAPKTGDVANHTLRWIKDGTSSATTNTPTEVDATNAPGIYKVTLTSTETDCLFGVLAGKSSTANVALFGVQIGFEQIPNAVPGAAGGVFIAGSNAATTVNFTGSLSGSVGSVTANVGITAAAVQAVWDALTSALTTVGSIGKRLADDIDGTITSRMATFTLPTNFSSLSIDGSGRIDLGKWIGTAPLALSAQQVQAVVPASTVVASVTGAVGSVTGAVGSVTGSVNSVVTGVTVTTNNDKTGYALTAGERNSVADALLDRDMSLGADSGSTTVRTPRQALRFLRNKWTIAANALTVFKEDDGTTSWTAVTTQTAGDPTSAINPAGGS